MSKRLFDIFFSAIGLILLLPLFIFVSIWIKIDSRGPIFFRQTRVGLFGEDFSIHKFRTMSVDAERSGRLTIGRDNRITSSGHFLRKSKVDELPQLMDVFIGKMSLVGPRPEVPEFMDHYQIEIRDKILSVRPGITDEASIEMVDENEILSNYSDPRAAYIEHILPVKQKYYLDYVENNNIFHDVFLIIKTVAKIFGRNR